MNGEISRQNYIRVSGVQGFTLKRFGNEIISANAV